MMSDEEDESTTHAKYSKQQNNPLLRASAFDHTTEMGPDLPTSIPPCIRETPNQSQARKIGHQNGCSGKAPSSQSNVKKVGQNGSKSPSGQSELSKSLPASLSANPGSQSQDRIRNGNHQHNNTHNVSSSEIDSNPHHHHYSNHIKEENGSNGSTPHESSSAAVDGEQSHVKHKPHQSSQCVREAKFESLEQKHVHDVYEKTAHHFKDIRFKAWPKVKQFLLELEPGSIVADIGKSSSFVVCLFSRNLGFFCHMYSHHMVFFIICLVIICSLS